MNLMELECDYENMLIQAMWVLSSVWFVVPRLQSSIERW